MKRAYERLLEYVKFDTASDANSPTVPSTMKQKDLGEYLVKEMKAMGIQDAEMDDKGYVYASVPATPGCENVPKIGFLAHLDTVDDVPACQDPRIVEKYDGSDVVLNQEHNVVMRLADFPSLQHMVGDDIIVTNGLTLLGADDKAGIAEILTAVERLLEDPSIPHGAIKMAFTPDEEIGRGPAHFDVKRFDADFGYTVDGGQHRSDGQRPERAPRLGQEPDEERQLHRHGIQRHAAPGAKAGIYRGLRGLLFPAGHGRQRGKSQPALHAAGPRRQEVRREKGHDGQSGRLPQ